MTLPAMKCAHCDRWMQRFVLAGKDNLDSMPSVAPLICDKCAEVNLLVHGNTCRLPSPEELEALKLAPIWPFLRDLQSGSLRTGQHVEKIHRLTGTQLPLNDLAVTLWCRSLMITMHRRLASRVVQGWSLVTPSYSPSVPAFLPSHQALTHARATRCSLSKCHWS